MEKFAEYGFNKSHSAAYALISYFTAYLKAHYRVEFMAALLSSEMGNEDKILRYVTECRDMGIKVLPPNVQLSKWTFSVHGEDIVFGLGGIKNLGEEAARELVAEREANGPFSSLLDFCTRLASRRLNRRALESMIKGGAFDCFELSRSALFNGLDGALGRAQKRAKDKASNQVSMLGLLGDSAPADLPGLGFIGPEQDLTEWSDEQKLACEKEALGFYLTSHPLHYFRNDLPRIKTMSIEDARELGAGAEVKIAVLITHIKEYITKKGDKMAFCQMEDLTGSGECTFLSKEYEEFKHLLGTEQPLFLEGRLDLRQAFNPNGNSNDDEDDSVQKEFKLTVSQAASLSAVCSACNEPVVLPMKLCHLTEHNLPHLQDIFKDFPGKAPVELCFEDDGARYILRLPSVSIKPDQEFYKRLNVWQHSLG